MSLYLRKHFNLCRQLVFIYKNHRYVSTDSSNFYKPKRLYVSKMFQNFGMVQPAKSSLSCSSHKLMLYNEIIQQCYSGHYYILPLGMRALEKLRRLIDEEMEATGAQKMVMPSMVPASLWKTSGRWSLKEVFKLSDRHHQDMCLSPTHEEVVTSLFGQYSPFSMKQFPIMLYQIGPKFRDEISPKYALLRCREFEMKDLYTFDCSESSALETYEKICEAYCRIFNRLKLPFIKVEADTGDIGGKKSHEFHLPSSVGEDYLLICESCKYGRNIELVDRNKQTICPKCGSECKTSAGIEVGHSFYLSQKYSSLFNATYVNSDNKICFAEMSCFGLGVTRILQAAIEVLSSERQISWPSIIAPYQVCIIPQKEGYKSDETFDLAVSLSDQLTSRPHINGEVVIDDRLQMTVGRRLYEAKRIGYPYIVIVGKRSLESPPQFEVISAGGTNSSFMSVDSISYELSQAETI
ncbi:probable proline--tRNA ligase, mitochondrial [Octopus vulgaris]|uniref:Probable proline--tRNA ligase, mitochondrial n=1 Tax=Octopus vulgaris TaxID=6645 RepID=A0AA36B0L6_OCTVU|nr:probable proline--tRNA ligase, mitochondrial [Octopus vulgaris]